MKTNLKRWLAIALCLVMTVGFIPSASAMAEAPEAGPLADTAAESSPSILDELTRPEALEVPAHADDEFVTVIVELDAPAVMEVDEYAASFAADSVAFSMDAAGAEYRESLLEQQARVKDEIVAVAGQALFRYSYTNLINGFAAYVPYGKLDAIKAIDGVSDVYETLSYNVSEQWDEGDEELDLNSFIPLDEYYENNDIDAASLLGLDVEGSLQADDGSMSVLGLHGAWEAGFTGAGKVAAIFDSGLYAQNQLFQYYDVDAMKAKGLLLDTETDADGNKGTIRTKEGIKAILDANKTKMNIFQASWDEWFHSWEGQYPEALPSGFGSDVQDKLDNFAFYTNDKVPFNVDYANGDFNTWVESKTVGTCPAYTGVSSHGTHVAGITAGNAGPNKDIGVLGSAYDAQIFFFKVFKEQDGAGQEGDEDVFAALDDAVTLGVNVFNLSLGIPNGFTTYNNVAQAGYQRAYNSARNAGISIAISAGNDARESRPGNDLGTNGGYTAILPNNSKVGGSTSTFSPYTVASSQGTGYVAWNRNNAPKTTAQFKLENGKTLATIELLDRNGPDALGEVFKNEKLELVYAGTIADVTKAAANAYADKAALVELTTVKQNGRDVLDYSVIEAAIEKGAKVCVVVGTGTSDSPLTVSYLQGGLAFGSLSVENGKTLKDVIHPEAKKEETGKTDDNTPATPASVEIAATPAEVLFADDVVVLDEVEIAETAAEDPTPGSGSGSATTTTPEPKPVFVTFKTIENDVPDQTAREYNDNGPVNSTSWGVTDALRLTPDILSPGGNILSAGVGHPNALATMSGTSMASPNMAGCLLLVQQYVDKLIKTNKVSVTKGTLEYATLVDEIMSSTALPYQPYKDSASAGALLRESDEGRLNKFFSPRRQGSGMGQLDKATSTLVYLHSTMDVGYNLLTGESQRAKIELGEIAKNAEDFTMSFVVENLDDAAHTFNVLSCLQTDATALNETTGRYNIIPQQSYGADIDAIGGAIIQVTSVTGPTGAAVTTESVNINRYSEAKKPAVITVPKGTTTVTVKVTLPDMKKYDDVFVNGMFVEGYVFLEDTTAANAVDLSIPYLGFRGDWNDAPLFDLATAYEDVSEKKLSDLDYPVYHIDNLHTQIKTGTGDDAVITDMVLGANQFTGAAVPQFNSTRTVVASMRSYLDTLRADKNLSGDWAAFSPDGDGKADDVYAQFGLLRNTKMVGVRILKDGENGTKTLVKDLGVEYEYFKLLASDGNLSQLVNTTAYDKYRHDLKWDGTKTDGSKAEDGQYYYQIAGLNEYDYLNLVNADETRTALNNYIKALNRTGPLVDKTNGELAQIKAELDSKVEASATALLWSEDNAHQSIMMPVKVDTTDPVVTLTSLDANTWKVSASDTGSGLQAIAVYYDGKLVGDVKLVNAATVDFDFDMSQLQGGVDLDKLTVQAVDFAMNVGEKKASETPATELPEVTGVTVTASATSVRPETEVTLTATVAPEGSIATSYQWYKATAADKTGAAAIKDATGKTYTPDTTEVGTAYYYCVVNGSITSDVITLSVSNSSGGGSSSGGSTKPTTPTEPTEPVTPATPVFTDVAESDWSYEAVKFVSDKGLINGTGDGAFSPNVTATRSMFATILWRLAGEKKSAGQNSFGDVVANSWYADAVDWAVEVGVVTGIDDETFAPNAVVTREQIAAMLYRYALESAKHVDNTQTLAAFKDASSVSPWAVDAMAWAVDAKLILGKDGARLDPTGLATRAEMATILMRFCQKLETEGKTLAK